MSNQIYFNNSVDATTVMPVCTSKQNPPLEQCVECPGFGFYNKDGKAELCESYINSLKEQGIIKNESDSDEKKYQLIHAILKLNGIPVKGKHPDLIYEALLGKVLGIAPQVVSDILNYK